MRALNEPKAAKFKETGAEFGVFKSNAPELNFCEPHVDMPTWTRTSSWLPVETALENLLNVLEDFFFFRSEVFEKRSVARIITQKLEQ